MEEMLGRLSSFSITEEEATVIGIPDEVIEKGRNKARFGMLGKVLSSKPSNKGSVMSTMTKLWAAEGDLSAQVIDRDTFLFSFEKEQDRARVLAMEPWSFNKALVLLKVVNGDEALGWDNWSFSCFWIRVYNLPFDGMIREIGEKIGNGIGKFIDVISDKNGRCPGLYMRLRVQIDVSKPLRRGATVQLGNRGEKVWTSFRYERVPDFCFGCGRLGHGRLECVDDRVRNVTASDRLFYSPELRVDNRSDRSRGPWNDGGGRWDSNSSRSARFRRTGSDGGGRREDSSNESEQSFGLGTDGDGRRGGSSGRSVGHGGSPGLISPDLAQPKVRLEYIGESDSGGVQERKVENYINDNMNNIISPSINDVVVDVHGMIRASGTRLLNDTLRFGDGQSSDGHHVDSSSPKKQINIPSLGNMHGTGHVEKGVAEGVVDDLIFSAGVVEPIKRSVGKWKKEARLKGANVAGSSSSLKLKSAKRKMGMVPVAGEVTKLRKTEGILLNVAGVAEAVAQPRLDK